MSTKPAFALALALALSGCMDSSPVTLSCSGKLVDAYGTNPGVLSIAIDTENKLLTVEGMGIAKPVPMSKNKGEDTVRFSYPDDTVNNFGSLNRVTGETRIERRNAIAYWWKFTGICKPASRMF